MEQGYRLTFSPLLSRTPKKELTFLQFFVNRLLAGGFNIHCLIEFSQKIGEQTPASTFISSKQGTESKVLRNCACVERHLTQSCSLILRALNVLSTPNLSYPTAESLCLLVLRDCQYY